MTLFQVKSHHLPGNAPDTETTRRLKRTILQVKKKRRGGGPATNGELRSKWKKAVTTTRRCVSGKSIKWVRKAVPSPKPTCISPQNTSLTSPTGELPCRRTDGGHMHGRYSHFIAFDIEWILTRPQYPQRSEKAWREYYRRYETGEQLSRVSTSGAF
jgi:hypothetical protein